MRHSEVINAIQNLTNTKPTQQKLADILGVSINTIGGRASRDSNYSVEEINKISAGLGVNILQNVTSALCNNDSVLIDYFSDVFGSCGSGAFVLSEKTEKIEVPKKLLINYSKLKKYSVINAYGDSMYPYIQDKDLLVVEHFEQGEQIRDNRVYVFRYGENIFVKRLVLNVNQIVIKSDNKDYAPIVIKIDDDFQIIGRIIGLMRSAE